MSNMICKIFIKLLLAILVINFSLVLNMTYVLLSISNVCVKFFLLHAYLMKYLLLYD